MLYRDKRACPFCRKKIDAKATVCPYCQKNVEPEHKLSPAKISVVGILGLFIVAGFLSTPSNKGTADNPSSRHTACAEAVKARLKAPTTAKFEWTSFGENSDTTEPFPYMTTGTVTSENSFGARLTKIVGCYHNGQYGTPLKVVILGE